MTDKMTGQKAKVVIGATTYECLNKLDYSGSVADLVAQCSGSGGATTRRRPGTPDDKFSFDVVLDSSDETTIGALKRGVTFTTFEAYPEGAATGMPKFSASAGFVVSANLSIGPNSLGIYSVSVAIDGDLTFGAAA